MALLLIHFHMLSTKDSNTTDSRYIGETTWWIEIKTTCRMAYSTLYTDQYNILSDFLSKYYLYNLSMPTSSSILIFTSTSQCQFSYSKINSTHHHFLSLSVHSYRHSNTAPHTVSYISSWWRWASGGQYDRAGEFPYATPLSWHYQIVLPNLWLSSLNLVISRISRNCIT